MLHMILGILKVIGLIIGILLLLSVLLALIFVPVRYKLTAKVLPGQYAFSLRGSWLLHIVSASVSADSVNGRRIALRLFGIRLPLFQPEDDTGEREDRDGRGEIESRVKKRKTRDTEKKETEDTGKKETGNTEKKKGKKKKGSGEERGADTEPDQKASDVTEQIEAEPEQAKRNILQKIWFQCFLLICA